MKKSIFFATMLASMIATTSCTNELANEPTVTNQQAKVKLTISGIDISTTPSQGRAGVGFSRASLSANDRTLTDIHIVDYVSGVPVGVLHQVSTDADFAEPTLSLPYGEHHLVCYATRSTTPAVFNADGSLSLLADQMTAMTSAPTLWGASKISDTFLGTADVNVTAQGASCTVTLNRITAQVALTIADEIPADASKLLLSFSHYSDRCALLTGIGTTTEQTREIDMTTVRGKSGQRAVVFTLTTGTTQYYTDLDISVLSSTDKQLTHLSLTDVPLHRNHTTTISGPIFAHGQGMTMTVNDAWDEDIPYEF